MNAVNEIYLFSKEGQRHDCYSPNHESVEKFSAQPQSRNKSLIRKQKAAVVLQSNLKEVSQDVKINEDKIFLHLEEAFSKKINPIELAFQKNDFPLAEHLFAMRDMDLVAGKSTFEHPGYSFTRQWSHGPYPIWLKPAAIRTFNEWGVEVYRFGENRVDVEALNILIKYDSKKLWKSYIENWLEQSYSVGDLETIATLLPLTLTGEFPGKHPSSWFVKVSNRRGYETDPFLSDFVVRIAPDAQFGRSCKLFEYRKDDNGKVHEFKRQIQEMIWGPLVP